MKRPLFGYTTQSSGRTGSGSKPKPGSVFGFFDRTEPNRHQRSSKTVDSNRTETLVPALRSTRTRRFRPPDQPEPVGSDLPINPTPSVAANRIHRSQPDTLGVTPRVKPIPRRFHPRFLTVARSLQFPPKRPPWRLPGAHVKNKRHTLHNHLYNHLYNHQHNVSI